MDATVATIFGTLRRDQRDAGAALIAALLPRNPVEATLAVRAAAAHFGSVECLRRTMLPDMPDNAGIRWAGKAVALSHMATAMLHALEQCQAAPPRAQPQAQLGARPAVPPAAASATAARPEAAAPARPAGGQAPVSAGGQAGSGTFDPRDPMPSERPVPAPAAVPVAARPAVAPLAPPAAAAQPQAAVAMKPAGGQAAMSVGRQDPMSSERPSAAPVAFHLKGWPTPAAFPFKTPPVSVALFQTAPADPLLPTPLARKGLRAGLLGSTSLASGIVTATNVQARPHVQ
jgi:hypothetical protein